MAMADLIDAEYYESLMGECLEKVCVVGAGVSGIAMCRALASRDIPFDCYERRSAAGAMGRDLALLTYADSHNLYSRVRFGAEVCFISSCEGGRWDVLLSDGTLRRYRAVAVASGFPQIAPAHPDLAASFAGRRPHAREHAEPDGSHLRIPFLDGALELGGGLRSLYRQVVAPGVKGLYFIGLLQSTDALMLLVEAQAEWVGDLLAGAEGGSL
jgi:hypothetical protein